MRCVERSERERDFIKKSLSKFIFIFKSRVVVAVLSMFVVERNLYRSGCVCHTRNKYTHRLGMLFSLSQFVSILWCVCGLHHYDDMNSTVVCRAGSLCKYLATLPHFYLNEIYKERNGFLNRDRTCCRAPHRV